MTDTSGTVGSPTILVVDDDPPLRRLILSALENRGYVVLEARNGAEATAVVRKHQARIDLVLTDVEMPHVDGFELVERLRQMCPETGVLYMTGASNKVPVRGGLKESGHAYLYKPFTPDKLVETIEDVLNAGTPREE